MDKAAPRVAGIEQLGASANDVVVPPQQATDLGGAVTSLTFQRRTVGAAE